MQPSIALHRMKSYNKLFRNILTSLFFLKGMLMMRKRRDTYWRVLWRLDGHKSGLRARVEELL